MPPSAWSFHNPVTVIFAPGAVRRLTKHVPFDRVALVTSPGFVRRGLAATVAAVLGERLVTVAGNVEPNPGLTDIEANAERLRASSPDALIALGGGSTIDTAKALARLLALPSGTPSAALLSPDAPSVSLPLIAIPTTSGTGAEVTPFGTIWDYRERKKRSIAGRDLYPKLAILDPELTLGLPLPVTVSSGLDAISHALESAWNRNANVVTLALVTRSLQLSLPALRRVVEEPENLEARADMMQASVLAGLAISQTRTALAHAVSYPLTIRFGLPHGLACSFTLPALLGFNAALDDGRLGALARALGYADVRELSAGLSSLLERLGARERLAEHLPERDAVVGLAKEMFAPGRAENNLRQASEDDVKSLVAEALDALRL